MGTKSKPSQFDGFMKAKGDEPLFTLLARDPLAPILVDLWWVFENVPPAGDPAKVAEAKECAKAMRARKLQHP